MKIAVTYKDGEIFQHFGHAEQFKVYDIKDGVVDITTIVSTNDNVHGALAGLLKKWEVDTLICGGIGAGAQKALAEAGIALYGGVTGEADQAVQDFLNKKLQYNPNVACSSHGASYEHHNCGNHEYCHP